MSARHCSSSLRLPISTSAMRKSSTRSVSPFVHKKQAVAVHQPEMFDLDAGSVEVAADSVGQNVTQIVSHMFGPRARDRDSLLAASV